MFVCKPFTADDQRRVYTPENVPAISRFASTELRSDTGGHHWVIDDDRNVYFVMLYPKDIRSSATKYLLAVDDRIAIVDIPDSYFAPVDVTIEYIDPGLRERAGLVESLLREAISVGGRFSMGAKVHSAVSVAEVVLQEGA